MSDTQTPTDPGSTTIRDDKGRMLEVRALDIVEELDLIEAAGADNSGNARWMMIATFAACVRAIDGRPVPFPTTRRFIRDQVGRVGPHGVRAVVKALSPEDVPDGAEAVVNGAGPLDAAKNSAGTSVFAS